MIACIILCKFYLLLYHVEDPEENRRGDDPFDSIVLTVLEHALQRPAALTTHLGFQFGCRAAY